MNTWEVHSTYGTAGEVDADVWTSIERHLCGIEYCDFSGRAGHLDISTRLS